MSNRELIGMALAFVGGFGGLANVLAWATIVDSLNTLRPPDKQIPVAITSREEWKRRQEQISEYGFMDWKLVRQFRKSFPESRAHYWYFGGIVWMFSFVAVGVVILFHH